MSEEVEQQIEETDEPDLMADLAAAWDLSGDTDVEDTEAPVSASEPLEAIPDSPLTETPSEQENASAGEESSQEASPADPAAPDDTPATAPPAVREAWNTLSDGVKDAWQERETQYANKIQEHAEKANFADSMMQAASPYASSLQMEANSPQEAFAIFGRITHTLRSGTPSEKASMVANLVTRYGVTIKDLDGALAASIESGGQPPQQPAAPQEFRDPRVDQIVQQQKAKQSLDANMEIQEFHKTAEFMNDVRGDMADILDMFTARGQDITLQEAYDKACGMNTEIQQTLRQRAAKTAVDKSNAASSISGAPAGGGSAAPGDLRGALEQAWGDS